MAPIPPTELSAPFSKATIIQLRTSKMKPMLNLSVFTGIYKQPRSERVFCSFTGLESDEHDMTFHGGVDKAVHQYFPGHYSAWMEDYPEQTSFEIGGFGENIVCEGGMNERNVCIGDVYRVGSEEDGVLLQVSLPRQPCFKLNHRFGIKGFAPQTWKKSRTGWYYRVLKEGWMGVGDEMLLVERKWPDWTIERIQEYLHREGKTNLAKLEELARIEEFGNECKGAFKRMVEGLAKGKEEKQPETWRDFTVVEKKRQTERITSFLWQEVDREGEGNRIDPGTFVKVKLPNGLVRAYSIVQGRAQRFQLGVALADDSRGGSKYMHEALKEGDILQLGKITSGVPMFSQASHHIFIAGGIGITAFLAHIDVYRQIGFNYELHYSVRKAEDIPFLDAIEKMGVFATIYNKEKGERMDIPSIIAQRKWNSQIYTCGPQRMVDEVLAASRQAGLADEEVHYEAFQAVTSGDPFTVELKKSKKTLSVDADKTLLQTLREAGLEVDSSCETGNCGTCRVDVCEGKVEHRGSGLREEEKKKEMLSCVSRGVGHIAIDF